MHKTRLASTDERSCARYLRSRRVTHQEIFPSAWKAVEIISTSGSSLQNQSHGYFFPHEIFLQFFFLTIINPKKKTPDHLIIIGTISSAAKIIIQVGTDWLLSLMN